MAAQEIKARVLANPEKGIANDLEATVFYDFGDSLTAASKKFTEAIVFETFIDAATVKLQAYIRSLLQRGSSPADIVDLVGKWKLGEKAERPVDVVAELKSNLAKLDSPAAKAEYIRSLAAQIGVSVEELQ